MAVTVTLPPDLWFEIAGLWVRVTPLDDPLLRADLHRVTVHRDEPGNAWVHVDGNNAGVHLQSVPPDTYDIAPTDGGPV
jgi:hypothetical protein